MSSATPKKKRLGAAATASEPVSSNIQAKDNLMNLRDNTLAAEAVARSAERMTTTRRSILGGFAAASALLVAPRTEAADSADADLFRLEAEFNAAYDRYDAACNRHSKIEERVNSAKPPRPVEPPMPKELDDAFVKLSIEEIRDGHPVCQAMDQHRKECRQLIDAWQAERNAIAHKSGLHEADAEQDRLMNIAADAADAVLDARATTLAGILAKLRVHDRWQFEVEGVLSAITADIQAMADAAVLPVVPGPAADETEHPWIKARRLARDLSAVLNDCDEGTQMAEIYPSRGHVRSIMFADIAYRGETARERLKFHGQQYARAARDIDPTATECYLGEAIDPDLRNRFSLIISRADAATSTTRGAS